MRRLSIVVPTLDEAAVVVATLQALAPLRLRGAEIIVVDGGSRDGTPQLAERFADRVMTARRGRGAALNAGASVARGDALLFLHADTIVPDNADRLILAALSRHTWGRFDLRIAGAHPLLSVVARMINLRSSCTGIATGDQAIFVAREAFAAVGGFADLPLMEDVALSRRLKRISRPARIRARVITSGRRWERNGVWRTIVLMWRLRLAYYLGAEPARLAKYYEAHPPPPSAAQGHAGP